MSEANAMHPGPRNALNAAVARNVSIECWVALCPHCHIIWPVDSWKEPRLFEHGQESRMTVGQYTVWHAAYRMAADRAFAHALGSGVDKSETLLAVMQAFTRACKASTIPCPGSEELQTGPVVLNGSPECDAMQDEVFVYHQARGPRDAA
jgi:hypothetical protein